jgi:hypothetical protein
MSCIVSGTRSIPGGIPLLRVGTITSARFDKQVGCQAALLWLLLLIFLPPREAEWRFCAVAKPSWMPV